MSAPLGFIGLGALGRAVAQRLATTGSRLLVWNRTPGRAAGLAEAAAVAEAAGIPRETALDVLGAGAGSSAVLAGKRAKVLGEDYAPHFSAALLYKDLHYLQDLARTLRRPVPVAASLKELVALAFPAGLEERDVAVLFPLLRDLGRPAVPPGGGSP